MSTRNKNRMFWYFSMPLLLSVIALTIAGSRLLINPGSIAVAPCGDVVMVREYPLHRWVRIPPPIVRYTMTVTPISRWHNDGYVCQDDNGRGQRYNHDGGRGFGQWGLKTFAAECINDPTGFVLDITYTALLADAIPLRPVRVTETVLAPPPAIVERCEDDQ